MKRIHVPVFAVLTLFSSVAVMAQMNHGSMHGGAAGAGTSSGGSAQGGGMQGGAMQGVAASGNAVGKSSAQGADMAMGEGLVKKVDKTKGTVTLTHGALPNGMPPMTMAYKVKDAAWLDTLQAGQKIRFATDPADGGMTVSHMELAK
jgi:Cu(I)/Ag(I) efflux system protein CusF